MLRYANLQPGDPTPWITARTSKNPTFHLNTMAGRYVVLCFFESAASEETRRFLARVHGPDADKFDDDQCAFFGVTVDPEDERQERVKMQLPGIRYFFDFDQNISRAYGSAARESTPSQKRPYRRLSLILDPRLRVLQSFEMTDDLDAHARELMTAIAALPRIADESDSFAPVLVVPRILEPALSKQLMDYYNAFGGKDSGFMRDINGKTVEVQDYSHKRRRDQEIEDESLRKECMYRIHDRLIPQIKLAFQFQATRIERYIVACYEAESGGHFRAHRDNTTKGTAHRRFAVSLNVNTGECSGGKLRVPEFGRREYEAPAGGAVVFSCSLLHEATPVTAGRRYAFLPFLYDDAAAQIRDANRKFVANAKPQ